MKRSKLIQTVSVLAVSLFVLFLTVLCVSAADLDAFLDEVQQKADTITSLQADFVQEKYLALFAQPVIFTGDFALVKPDRLRWEFNSPIPSVLILNEDKAIRCNDQAAPEKINLSADPVMKGVADQLWLWLGGSYQQLKEQYTISQIADLTLRIVPISDQTAGFIDHVEIVFDSKSLLPVQVSIYEPGGDKTVIRFTENRINQEVPPALFTSCEHVG